MFIVVLLLKIILYIFLALVFLLVLFLTLPVTYSGQVWLSDGIKADYRFGWPWRFLSVMGTYNNDENEMGLYIGYLRLLKLNTGIKKNAEEEEVEAEADDSDKKKGKSFSIRELFDEKLLREMTAYLKKIIKAVKPKYLHLRGTYGFEDPALTGMASGAIGIIRTLMPHARLYLSPDFAGGIIDIDIRAEGRMSVGSLAYQTARTFLKKEVRQKLFKKREKS
ncbi:MAG: DUF2953 domain-containing protein [Bacillota bacterium]